MPISFHSKTKISTMISFTSIDVSYRIKNKLKVRNWIKSIIVSEGKLVGDITYVFCTDEYLGSMNQKYLNHNTLTDIITFDYSEKEKLAGDVFISIERITENSSIYNTALHEELGRVMAHGVLHLSGYDDGTEQEQKMMRSREDYYIAKRGFDDNR